MNIFSIITGLLGLGTNWIEGAQKRATVKLESKLRIEEAEASAKVALLNQAAQHEQAWDLLWAEGAKTSWKDEWFVIILSLPIILVFLGFDEEITKGFAALGGLPDWYIYSFLIAVAASFGFRKLTDIVRK